MSFFFGKSELEEAIFLTDSILKNNAGEIEKHEWHSQKKNKLKFHQNCCTILKRLSDFNGDKESLYNLRDFFLNLIYKKKEKIRKENNPFLVQLQKYIEEQSEWKGKEKIKQLELKLKTFQALFEGEKINLERYGEIIGNKVIRRITEQIHKKIDKYDGLMKGMNFYTSIEKAKKFKKLLEEERFSEEEWKAIQKFSERIEKGDSVKNKKSEFKIDEDLPLFVKELKTLSSDSENSKIIDEFLQKDNSGSFAYFVKKIKELNKLKSIIQKVFHGKVEYLQYEVLISKDIQVILQQIMAKLEKLSFFQKQEKMFYSPEGFKHHLKYIEEVNERLYALQKKYMISDFSQKKGHPYYTFYIRISGIIAHFERKSMKQFLPDDPFIERMRAKLKLDKQANENEMLLMVDELMFYHKELKALKLAINKDFREDEEEKKYENYIANLKEENRRMKEEIKRKENEVQLQRESQKTNSQLKLLQQELQRTLDQKNNLAKSLESVQLSLSQTASMNEQKQKEKLKLTDNLYAQQKEKNRINETLISTKEQYEKLKKQFSLLEQSKVDLKEELNNKQKKIEEMIIRQKEFQVKMKGLSSSGKSYHMFCGSILASKDPAEFKRLIQEVQMVSNCQLKKTKLLYKMDLKNKVNFLQYIYNHQNLLVLVQLKNGMIIGGYGNGLFQKTYKGLSGVLFNWSKGMYFNSQPEYKEKVMNCDGYHLFVGNSDIRIRFESGTMVSNFGIGVKYFKIENYKMVDFLGEDRRDQEMKTFEIHEMIFE